MPLARLQAMPGRPFFILLAALFACSASASASNPIIPLAIRLKMRNPQALENLLLRLYTPNDSLYGKFLSRDEFTSRFGATQEDFDRVADYFRSLGCDIRFRHPSRLLLDVDCPQNKIELAFKVKITRSLNAQGNLVQTVSAAPTLPHEAQDLPIEAVHGLSSQPRIPQYIHLTGSSSLSGSGPGGGLSPSDIKVAYGLSSTAFNGADQTLALFELDGFTHSDITAYASKFGLPAVPTQTVLIDGFNGKPGQAAAEVTLDIQLMNAVAPGARQILVYEGPNTDSGVVDVYQRIADDDLARQISSSWGLPEDQSDAAMLKSENQIFEQMAAQGQTIFAASGDHGAFDDGKNLGVDDPASQPFVTGTGGTTLQTGPDHSYASETSWWNGSYGAGGGISTIWPIPAWQQGVPSSASLGSATKRNVPDISLDADPQSGYSIYLNGSWQIYGGTSCAAPLWAAFTALVNQDRAQGGKPPLGFANPALYRVGKNAGANDFHDLTDGSTNGYYPAVTGYDLSTGWGTIRGQALLSDLASAPAPSPSPEPSPSPTPSPSPSPVPSPTGGIAAPPLIDGLPVYSTNDPYQTLAIDYDVSGFSGAIGIYFEISQPNQSLLPPNSDAPDPQHLLSGENPGARGRLFLQPIRYLPGWGNYSIRVIPLGAGGQPVGLFSDSSHLILEP